MLENAEYKEDANVKATYYRLKHYLEKYPVDQQWLLTVIATVNPQA